MRREKIELARDAATQRFFPFQRVEKCRHRRRVPSRCRAELLTDAVRLAFLLAIEWCQHEVGREAADAADNLTEKRLAKLVMPAVIPADRIDGTRAIQERDQTEDGRGATRQVHAGQSPGFVVRMQEGDAPTVVEEHRSMDD